MNIEKNAPSQDAERNTKLLFIKTFRKPDGGRYVYFESVTVRRDGMEISVSSHEADRKVIKKEMQNGNVLHLNKRLSIGSEGYLTETPIQERPDLVPTSDNNGFFKDVPSTDKSTAKSAVKQTIGEKVAQAEAETEQNPTDAQKEAGNYKKGHVRIDGYDVTIENPKGSVRRGTDPNGNPWETTMHNTYGYIRGTEGVDGDHIDVFLSDDPSQGKVYVVDQVNPSTGEFDEHKVMYGFNSEEEARSAYLSNYSPGWKGLGTITEVSKADFKKWVDSSHRKTKPFAEYKSVKVEGVQNETITTHQPHELPGRLMRAYESGDAASIASLEQEMRDFVNGENDMRRVYATYLRSKELERTQKKGSPGNKTQHFIAEACKDALKKAGLPAKAMQSERARTEVAGSTTDPHVLDVMSADTSFHVLRAIVHNLNTSEATLKYFTEAFSNNGLDYEAQQELEKRQSKNGDELRFREVDVEDRKELVAVHNLSADKLKQAFELGGFPMPSIAITKAEIGHTEFGEISLVFDKESINPSDRRNKVYGEDAWTPTFPAVGYKLNEEKTRDIYRRANKAGRLPLFNPVHFHPDNYGSYINGLDSESLVNHFKDDYGAKQLYLSEKGNAVEQYEQHEVEKYLPDQISLYEKILKDIGIERLKNERTEALENDVKKLIEDHYHIDLDAMKPFRAKIRISNAIHNAIDYAEHGNRKKENDLEATKAKIDDRVDPKQFESWLREMFDGIVEKRGIRNDKDAFTPSGNQRKWESLYDEITLDNVVKAMQRQAERGGQGLFGGSIFGAAQKEYQSVDEIRKEARERIRTIDDAAYQAQRDAITNRLSDIKIAGVGNRFSDTMDMVESIQNAVSRSHTAKGIYKYLKKYYPGMTMETANEIADIVKDIQRMSARYFESKSYRSVGFDEVRLAVVPSDTDPELVRELDQRGIPVRTYERGNEAQRRQIVEEATDEMNLRFRELQEVNERFNEQLADLTEENADRVTLSLGRPSEVLRAAGVADKPMKLYGNKVMKKMRKHGFALDELRDLPRAVADPIAVFNNYQKEGNRSILTELRTGDKNILVSITIGKNGVDADFNIISSVFGKGGSNIVDWINKGYATYINKEKALAYLHFSERSISEASDSQELVSAANIVRNFENPSVESENLSENAQADATSAIESAVAELGGRLNTPVRVVHSPEEVENESVRRAIEAGRPVKGWYDTRTGEIVVYAPNASSVEDALQTVLHEAVGHHGLRELVGDEHFDAFLDDIYNRVDERIRQQIDYLSERHGWHTRVAAEEYLASLAEEGRFEQMKPTWWQRIKSAFLRMLHRAGIRIGRISDNELRYILWRSYENLAEPGRYRSILGEAADVAKQSELKVGNYAPSETATSNAAEQGVLYREGDTGDHEELLSGKVEGTSPLEGATIKAWDNIAQSDRFKLVETAFDYLNAVDKFQKLIAKRSGKNIKDFENAYDAMSFLSSKNRTEMDMFDSFIVTPLNNAIVKLVGEIKKKDVDWGKGPLRDLVKYVEAKHGVDRNRQMAVENYIKNFGGESLEFYEKSGIGFNKDSYRAELKKVKEAAGDKAYTEAYDKNIKKFKEEGIDEAEAQERATKMAKSAKEKAELRASEKYRNRIREELAEQYKEKVTTDWNNIKNHIKGRDDLSWEEKQRLLDEVAVNLGSDLSQDYSGLSSVFGNEEEYPDGWKEEALRYVTEYENSHDKNDIDGLWHAINNATGYTLQKQYETGLVSREYVERQRERFDNYIPLRGFEDETAGDVYSYIGDDYYPGGNPVKTAHGRTSEAGNPFGSILNTAYASISAGNKNVAKTALYSLVRNHDTGGLAVVNRAWAVKYSDLVNNPELSDIVITPQISGNDDVSEWVESVPRMPKEATAEEISNILNKFESTMNKYRSEGITKPIGKRSKIAYRTLHNERSQHEIPLFIGGNKYVITITGNPRVAQAMNGLLNPDSGDTTKLTEMAKRAQRFMSSAFTAKNPAFSLANLTKDSIYANNQTFIRENPRYWLKFTKNQRVGFGELPLMMSRLMKFQEGTLDMNDKTERMFKEFMENGGATGYTFVNSQEEYAKELEKKLRDLSSKAPKALTPQGLWKIAFDAIEFAGQSAELINRFAAYKTSREMGRPVIRCIRDAKEITVNFNRKGAGKKTADKNNKGYINFFAALSQYGQTNILFWNANMQAKYRFFKNMQEHPIKTSTTLIGNSMLISGIILPVLNSVLLPALYNAFGDGDDGDDDDKENYFNVLTDWERTHNVCIRLPKGYWLKLPLSPEMTPWFSIGDAIGGAVTGQRELSASDFIHSSIDAVSPMNINWQYEGWTFALNFTPTVGQPIAQNMMNVNFMGNPIKKKAFTSMQEKNPEYKMVYRSASPTLIEISRLNNRLWGGEDDKTAGLTDFNPSMIQNFISGYSGGYGTTMLSIADWIINTSKGEKQAATFSKMPLVSRFVISGDKDMQLQRVNSKFYDVKNFVEDFEFDVRRYEKRIEEGQKENNALKVADGVSEYEKLLQSERASKYVELKNYTDSVESIEDYLKEFPEDEETRNLLLDVKRRGISILKDDKSKY